MYEIFKSYGLPIQLWLLSMLAACLAAVYRIMEPEKPLAPRKTASIVIGGVISGVLVPGLLDHVLHIENSFWSAAITGLTVYCFEPLMAQLKIHYLKNVKNGND